MALSMLLIVLLLSCLLSFTRAMLIFFTQPAGETTGMRVIKGLGMLIGIMHIIVLALSPARAEFAACGAGLYCASLVLFWWALSSHRQRRLSAAFSPDQPQHLAQNGPYRFIRHPFYASYLLTWLAAPIAIEAWWMLATSAIMAAVYYHAARMEESKFISSELAGAYAAYRSRTGMFLPSPLKMLAALFAGIQREKLSEQVDA